MAEKRQAPDSFTREQTEALKQYAGIDEFYPNFWEVQRAGEIFKAELITQMPSVERGENTIDTIVNLASVKVWTTARRYQSEKESKPKQGIKAKLYSLLPFRASANR